MAAVAEKKTDDTSSKKYKIEDIYDIKEEEKLLQSYINIALAPQDETWTKTKTKNPKLLVDYKYLQNDSLCTIRGKTVIPNASVNQYHQFCESGYNDVYAWEKGCDPMCTENRCVKSIDINHEIVYGSYDSGLFVISPRDFCYIKARYLLTDFKGPNGDLFDISCTLCYSITDKHPFYRGTKKKHVRAILKYSGYVFMENKTNPNKEGCTACYIVYLDPCGWIPTWVVNLVAPDQGMVIKAMLENWPKVAVLLAKRKEKGYAKDYAIMFESENGLWEKATSIELFDAANAIKSDVEMQAKEDGKSVFKIFEVVSGTKQVADDGMDIRINVKVDDDMVIKVWVFKSKSESYQLKSVTY